MDPAMILLLEAMLEKSHSPEEFQAYVRCLRTQAEQSPQPATIVQAGQAANVKVEDEAKKTKAAEKPPTELESLIGNAAVTGLGMMLGPTLGAGPAIANIAGAGDLATKLVRKGANFVEDLIGFDIPMIGG